MPWILQQPSFNIRIICLLPIEICGITFGITADIRNPFDLVVEHWLASKFNEVSVMNLFADIVLVGIWFLVSFFLIFDLLPCDLNTKDLIKCVTNVDTFLDNGRKMKVWKLLTVLICGYKFIIRGFEVFCVKTYCLFSKVTKEKYKRSRISLWIMTLLDWALKMLKKNGECTFDPCWPRLGCFGYRWMMLCILKCLCVVTSTSFIIKKMNS